MSDVGERPLAELLAQTQALYTRHGRGQRFAQCTAPAVLVVDLQIGITQGDHATPTSDQTLASTADLLTMARAADLQIFYTYVAYRADMSDAGVWAQKLHNLARYREGTSLVEIDDRVRPAPADRVIRKNMASAFFGTTLASDLTTRRIDALIVAGSSTSGCVRATVVDGVSHGFKMYVVRDCVEDRAPASHEVALFDMDAKYADVIALADVADLLPTDEGAGEGRTP